MITIVDYGMGNLRSVRKALEKVGSPSTITQDARIIERSEALVVPGVGAFKQAMENLQQLGLVNTLREFIASGRPFLGICLGLQLLFSESEEFGRQSGLGVLEGRVVKFPDPESGPSPEKDGLKVPHMGWNTVRIKKEAPLLRDIPNASYFYFVHSYYPVPENPEIIATTTEYGQEFASSVTQGNLFACQFHPEKSQVNGLKILENFGRLVYR